MPTQKLTTRSILVTPPATGTLELWDTVVPGLALRVSYGGTRSWSVMTRLAGGRQIRRKIGTTATHTLAEARDEARNVIRDAANGVDSRSKIVIQRAQQEAARAEAGTFEATAEDWLADSGRGGGAKLRSRSRIESRLQSDVYPVIGALPIAEITRGDIRKLVEDIAKERPILANRILGHIRRVFSWAVSKDRLDASPAVGIEPPADEVSRDRVLRDSEIKNLWRAFEEIGYPFGPIFQLLLLTGSRRNEVSGMEWSEIQGNKWHLPGERTKNGRPHMVPLSTPALEILSQVPRMDDSDFLFTTTGESPASGFSRVKERVDAAAGVTGWVIHDLRRTVVTGMAELDIDPHVIEAAVNHVSGAARAGVAGVYNRATYLPQRTAALESWAQHVMEIVHGKSKSNVTKLKRA